MSSLTLKDCPYISNTIQIEFDGKLYDAREGDTVASALLRNNIRINSDLIRQGLRDSRIPFLENDSHIIPIHLYDPDLCKEAANVLIEEHGVYIQPIFYPTVPKGDERFRVTITPRHEAGDIDHFLDALDDVWKLMDLQRSEESQEEKPAVSRIY